MIKCIDHIVITTADIDKCVDFYEKLGFVARNSGGAYSVFAGDFKINIHILGKEFSPHAENVQTGSGDFCFEISGNIRTLIDYLILERNWISKENLRIYFSPVTDVQNTNAHNGCHSWSGFADIHESLIEYLYQIRAYKEIEFSIPTPMYYACGALTSGSIVIDPDGDIYKCYEVIGQKKYAVGDIFSGQKFDDNLMKWLLLDTLPECDDCIFLPMCQSACPLDRLTNNSKNCHHVKKSYKKPLEKAYLIHSGAVNGEFI